MDTRQKEVILNQWILMEYLNEDEVSEKCQKKFENISPSFDFYSELRKLLPENEKTRMPNKKRGICLYCGVSPFQSFLDVLEEEYSTDLSEADCSKVERFSFLLWLDEDLNLLPEKTFFGESTYLCSKEKQEGMNFFTYKDQKQKEVEKLFEKVSDRMSFNRAMRKLLEFCPWWTGKNCWCRVSFDVAGESDRLHSFFMKDLEKAKRIESKNLDTYLFGVREEDRVSLEDEGEGSEALKEILQPRNYPLGRFPGKTEYSLYLMQQAAVNIATMDDGDSLQSVNGPPGTGKTKLLKDVIAALIVRQAHEIAIMNRSPLSFKFAQGSRMIKELPLSIRERNIVVASSNNGAVQNIVNDLPRVEKIDEKFLPELREADYFTSIANENEKDSCWGLFSLEGGKREDRINLQEKVQRVLECLNSSLYESDPTIYETFERQYRAVSYMRSREQERADEINRLWEEIDSTEKELEEGKAALLEFLAKRGEQEALLKAKYDRQIGEASEKEKDLLSRMEELRAEEKSIAADIEEETASLSEAEKHRPRFFLRFKARRIYARKKESILHSLNALKSKRAKNYMLCSTLSGEIEGEGQKQIDLKRRKGRVVLNLDQKERKYRNAIAKANEQMNAAREKLASISQNALNLENGHEKNQLSHPWFDEEYSVEQSKLFITALRVRKQFLYENRKSVSEALIIENNLYRDNVDEKSAGLAWSWINLTIPVIGSTFASIASMCRKLGANSLGYLLIDEAGQALPQASVGAIYRSSRVLVMGDPSQIPPVQTIDRTIPSALSTVANLDSVYLSEKSSTQVLCDRGSRFGYRYKGNGQEFGEWIGIPLWVNYRCQDPMFSISNRISYHNLMVPAKTKGNEGMAGWFDVRETGREKGKYVEAQGEFLRNKILELESDPSTAGDDIFVISPFREVASNLAKVLDSIGFTIRSGKKLNKVGTIHTFQGREASIVFLVLGATTRRKNAARWALREPNMINVAATRAKEAFYIIGDRDLYETMPLGRQVSEILDDYRTIHPDLVEM